MCSKTSEASSLWALSPTCHLSWLWPEPPLIPSAWRSLFLRMAITLLKKSAIQISVKRLSIFKWKIWVWPPKTPKATRLNQTTSPPSLTPRKDSRWGSTSILFSKTRLRTSKEKKLTCLSETSTIKSPKKQWEISEKPSIRKSRLCETLYFSVKASFDILSD